jgi:hypothetical protein
VSVNEELLTENVAAPVKNTEINDRRGSAALTKRHPLSAKVGTKFRREVAVGQSVYFACRLRATESVCESEDSTKTYATLASQDGVARSCD